MKTYGEEYMKNNLSIDEIKQSVEYQWRKSQIKLLLMIFLIMTVTSLVILFLINITSGLDTGFVLLEFFIWFCCMIVIGIFLGCFVLYYHLKCMYLLNNYKNFNAYEVILDTFSTSYAYEYSIYYTVTFIDDNETKKRNTNPYFSSSFFSKFKPEEFNNKKVIGLYDNNLEKFYIIKSVD